jgi:alkaline phosphatase
MIKRTNRRIVCTWLVVISLFIIFPLGLTPRGGKGKVKNMIIFMFDGQGLGGITGTRWYKGQPLAIDRMNAVLCSNPTVNTIITDSAAAATAFATGHKTAVGHLAVLATTPVTNEGVTPVPEDKRGTPVASLLEGAKFKGKATGLIATAFMQDASPAAFSAHTSSRSNYEAIAEQQVYQDIDVVLGSGSALLLPEKSQGLREDGEDLVEVLKQNGYDYITTRADLLKSAAKKLWGMFAPLSLAFELDRRQLHPDQPSLAEMTGKALEILSKNPKGFFLFVEASQVDWAGHFNSPLGVIGDTLALDEAVTVAQEFAKTHKKTQILVFADHETGGMTIGNNDTDETDTELTKDMVFGPLKKAKLTGNGIQQMLGKDPSREKIIETVGQYYGITDLTEAEIEAIAKCSGRCKLMTILGPMMSKRTRIGWTTHGHVANDILCFYDGPLQPKGHIDNTQIALMSAQAMGFRLEEISEKLFVDAEKALTALGAVVTIDETDAKNPILAAQKGNISIHIPFYKNILTIGTQEYHMPGVAVFVPESRKLFIPQEAIDLARKNIK